jgi:hypothetical protein
MHALDFYITAKKLLDIFVMNMFIRALVLAHLCTGSSRRNRDDPLEHDSVMTDSSLGEPEDTAEARRPTAAERVLSIEETFRPLATSTPPRRVVNFGNVEPLQEGSSSGNLGDFRPSTSNNRQASSRLSDMLPSRVPKFPTVPKERLPPSILRRPAVPPRPAELPELSTPSQPVLPNLPVLSAPSVGVCISNRVHVMTTDRSALAKGQYVIRDGGVRINDDARVHVKLLIAESREGVELPQTMYNKFLQSAVSENHLRLTRIKIRDGDNALSYRGSCEDISSFMPTFSFYGSRKQSKITLTGDDFLDQDGANCVIDIRASSDNMISLTAVHMKKMAVFFSRDTIYACTRK